METRRRKFLPFLFLFLICFFYIIYATFLLDEKIFVDYDTLGNGRIYRPLRPRHIILNDATSWKWRPISAVAPSSLDAHTTIDDGRLAEKEGAVEDPSCKYMRPWQAGSFPTCNSVHELEFRGDGIAGDTGGHVSYLGRGGGRDVWKMTDIGGERAVVKTLKQSRDFVPLQYYMQNTDALVMERLTFSPHVVGIHGYCGQTCINEFADGGDYNKIKDKKMKGEEKLKYAVRVAESVRDLQEIDDRTGLTGGRNATVVHGDVSASNFVLVNGVIKLNDFNMARLLKWNPNTNAPCQWKYGYVCGGDGRRADVSLFWMLRE
uniref:Protein kinase domain-containing protein n=1 Tax=Corethron hystrix TaxID=216773 RepID=A0A7S1BCM1_9STRA|mmetsp:Transcript_22157/g.50719  ORF Transcript_22157/g.50719 Transcript_22157/m.50719 type:complete len:319 (+) Transcript_22157:77-1033(+)